MPGTRTATVPGTDEPIVRVTFRLIDAKGDVRSVAISGLPASFTDSNIEAVAAALQALTNASLWSIEVTNVYSGQQLRSNATTDSYQSADQVINMLLKSTANPATSDRFAIRAPLDALVLNNEQIDLSAIGTLATAVSTLKGASWYMAQARFTERSDRNDATKA